MKLGYTDLTAGTERDADFRSFTMGVLRIHAQHAALITIERPDVQKRRVRGRESNHTRCRVSGESGDGGDCDSTSLGARVCRLPLLLRDGFRAASSRSESKSKSSADDELSSDSCRRGNSSSRLTAEYRCEGMVNWGSPKEDGPLVFLACVTRIWRTRRDPCDDWRSAYIDFIDVDCNLLLHQG